jgi:hypothetical protein
MAEEQSLNTQEATEEQIADFLFPETKGGQEPVAEGDEAEPEAVEAVETEDEGDDEAPEEIEAQEDADEASEYVEVEYDGRIYEVPNELKDALLRQDDYTRKTQEVAESRKSVEVVAGELQQAMADYEFAQSINPDVMKAQALQQQEEQLHQYLRDNVENLTSTDIEKVRFGIEDARGQREELMASIKQKEQAHHQAQEQTRAELLKKGSDVLKSKIPGWGEEKAKQVRDFALSSGFVEAEINGVVDPRYVEVLWKASQYDSLKAGAAPAVKKVQTAPTIKPKSRNPMPDKVKKKLALNKRLKSKNLSAPEKANLIGEDIASRFF